MTQAPRSASDFLKKILIFRIENIFRHLISVHPYYAILGSIYHSKGLSEFFNLFIFGPAFPPVKWAGDCHALQECYRGKYTVRPVYQIIPPQKISNFSIWNFSLGKYCWHHYHSQGGIFLVYKVRRKFLFEWVCRLLKPCCNSSLESYYRTF